MKIEIFVTHDDDLPHRPGTAHVFIDDARHAKLRSGESYRIVTTEDYLTTLGPGLTRKAVNAKAER